MILGRKLLLVFGALPLLAFGATASEAASVGNDIQWGKSYGGCADPAWGFDAHRGDTLVSDNGVYRFVLQADSNMVVYHGNTAVWSSRTNGKSASRFNAQCDGNLVLRSSSGATVWAAGSNRGAGYNYMLIMQDDGNLAEYFSSGWPYLLPRSVAWASGTAGK